MQTFTTDELQRQPERLLDDAGRGELAVATRDGKPLLLELEHKLAALGE